MLKSTEKAKHKMVRLMVFHKSIVFLFSNIHKKPYAHTNKYSAKNTMANAGLAAPNTGEKSHRTKSTSGSAIKAIRHIL